jgi:hypothetical protein
MPFCIHGSQFAILVAISMTIKQAQEETFKKLKLNLPPSVFIYGQLHVTISSQETSEYQRKNTEDEQKHRMKDYTGMFISNILCVEVT